MFGLKLFGKAPEKKPGRLVLARLNARVQPIDRGDYFEDPLDEILQAEGLGEVTGGGTQLADEPAGIEFVDVEIHTFDTSNETLETIMSALEDMGAPKGSRLLYGDNSDGIEFGKTEGLALFLNGIDLPDDVYQESDVNHVVEECERLMPSSSFLGHWEGSAETGLYFYGKDFAAMKTAIADFVGQYPLCQKSRIEQIA